MDQELCHWKQQAEAKCHQSWSFTKVSREIATIMSDQGF